MRLAYTYLVSWYVFHYPSLMILMSSINTTTPFIESVVLCSWASSRLLKIRWLLSRPKSYQLYRCSLKFDETAVDGSFGALAMDNGPTILAFGPFTWLLNICPGYHLFHWDMECWIEPYTPLRFAHQFGY